MNGNYAPLPGKIPGADINLGGHDFKLAPLNLEGVKAASPLLDVFGATKSPAETLEVAAKIILLSLNRNYPDMTIEDVLGLVDVVNVRDAIEKIYGASGIVLGKPGESRSIP